MRFSTLTSPFTDRPNTVTEAMKGVLVALIPGVIALWWYFGWGVIVNLVLAIITALACEALAMRLRGRPVRPAISDLSAVLTAVLFAVAVPPLLPWWLTVIGVAFAILLVKHAYGGLGYNPFNPAMAAYVLLLISWPVPMTSWLPPDQLAQHHFNLLDSLHAIFWHAAPEGMQWDAITAATPLDVMRTQLGQNHTLDEIRQNPLWGLFGGQGWEWVGVAFLLGGIYMLWRRLITWHIPVGVLGGLLAISTAFYLTDPATHPSPLFHLFSGATLLGAFFIATDPVTACTTRKGQLIFGASIGVLIFLIRTWGGYPDAVAFAVLLMNIVAPTIDHYTQPRVFGHGSQAS